MAAQLVSPAGSATATGENRVVVVPSPTCPVVLSPQHHPSPIDETAHVWLVPAEMLTKVDSKVAEAARTRELRARRATGDDCALGVALTVATDIVGEAEAYAGTAVASFLGVSVANA